MTTSLPAIRADTPAMKCSRGSGPQDLRTLSWLGTLGFGGPSANQRYPPTLRLQSTSSPEPATEGRADLGTLVEDMPKVETSPLVSDCQALPLTASLGTAQRLIT